MLKLIRSVPLLLPGKAQQLVSVPTSYDPALVLQVVQRSEATTMMGLQKELNDAAAILRR